MKQDSQMKTFLCIDLEATCFDRETLGRDLTVEDMETIEIGVIALDEAGEGVGEFHSYVKPANTEVSPYCTDVTGITAHTLADAPGFADMMEALRRWLSGLPASPDCWYSWGNYDLKQLELDASAKRSNLVLPLPPHRNAKKLFQKQHIRKGRQVGLLKALELVNLTFKGRHHSALDDARNVARLFEYFHNPAKHIRPVTCR